VRALATPALARRWAGWLIAALLCALAGALPTMAAGNDAQDRRAAQLLLELGQTPPQDYANQRRLLEEIIEQCPDSTHAPEAYWRLAEVYKHYLGLPDYTAIALLFEKYLSRYPRAADAPMARRQLIEAYEKTGQWEPVAAYFAKDLGPMDQLPDSRLFQDGLSYAQALEHTGRTAQAKAWYQKIVARDGGANSPAAAKARQRLAALGDEPRPSTNQAAPPVAAPTPQPAPTPLPSAPAPTPAPHAQPTTPLPLPPTPGAAGATCRLEQVASGVDLVGRAYTPAATPDGAADSRLSLDLPPGDRVLLRIDLQAAGGRDGWWSTVAAEGVWPMAVRRADQPDQTPGRMLRLEPGSGGCRVELFVQDNGALAGGRPLTALLFWSDGQMSVVEATHGR